VLRRQDIKITTTAATVFWLVGIYDDLWMIITV